MKRVHMVLLALCLLLAGCGGQKTDEVDLKPVCIDGKWGYTNAKGELVIDAKYNMAYAFYEGLALVTDDPNKLFWKYIDTNGNQAIDDQYGKAGNFSMGLAMVMIAGKCGYINKKGEIVIEPQYQFARAFAGFGKAFEHCDILLVKVGNNHAFEALVANMVLYSIEHAGCLCKAVCIARSMFGWCVWHCTLNVNAIALYHSIEFAECPYIVNIRIGRTLGFF